MSKKKKLKKQLLFNVINTIIILFFVCFYVGRLIYYYFEAEKKKNTDVDVALVDKLINYVSKIDMANGLIENEDGTYTYKGQAKYNYVKYSGRIYRVISLDKEKNIKMIAENSQTIMMPGVEDYKDSYLRDWLDPTDEKENTGIYLNTLNNPYEYLTNSEICLDKANDIESISCEDKSTDYKISLLSLNDYKMIGGANSYLNNGEDFFLLTQNDTNNYWYVAADGGLNVGQLMNETHGIRPVLTLMNSTITYDGNGTKADPYIIEEGKITSLVEASVSEYVSFSDYKWQIIGKEEDKVKLVMDGYITENEEIIAKKFGANNAFANKSGNIGYYLNNDFYNSLTNKEILTKSKCYYGKYKKYASFNYQDQYESSIDCFVGLLNIGDLYVNKYANILLMTRPYGDNDIIYTINDTNLFFTDYVSNELNIRPTIYVSNAKIVSGNGTNDKPYVLGAIIDE